MPPPWFVTGSNCTEDVYFCVKARNTFNNAVNIFVDTSVRGGHLLDAEFVDYSTRPALQKFYETLRPELADKSRHERGEEATEANVAKLKAKYELGDETLAVGMRKLQVSSISMLMQS